jgi:predicted adenine nucleotide alpha hydrolase (AANH) superfamily ATPase
MKYSAWEAFSLDTLLHICCAPCSVACVAWLREDGIEPHGFWYNPNIHPFTEYRQRRNTLQEYAGIIGMQLTLQDEYALRPFMRAVCSDLDNRCAYCYRCRLEAAARFAAENGFSPSPPPCSSAPTRTAS